MNRVSSDAMDQIRREWASAGIGNAFIFGKVMTTRPDLLLELLQYSLPEMQIQSISDAGREVDIKLSIDAHGVRLDVMVHDDHGRTIDVEMQLRDEHDIPRRMRYYTGAVDQTILEGGMNYADLTDTVIMFITPFDPFGRNLMRYTFRSICIEEKDLELGDGTVRVVLNAKGTKGEVSRELQDFLDLVANRHVADRHTYAKGSYADRVQEQVVIARENSEWRREYMEWKMTLLNEWTKGRAEGRAEGLAEGKEVGALLKQIELITKKIRRGMELPAIAEMLEVEEESIKPIYDAVKASAPDYNSDEILRRIRG